MQSKMKNLFFFISILITCVGYLNASHSTNSHYDKKKLATNSVKYTKAQRHLKSKGNLKNGNAIKPLTLNIAAMNNQIKAQKKIIPPMSAIHNRVLENIKNKKKLSANKQLKNNYIKKTSIG